MKRNILKALVAATLVLSTMNAMADSNADLINALVNKGVLTPEEAAVVLKEAKVEKKEAVKNSQPTVGDELPVKFYGTIRTFLDHDTANVPTHQPDAKVSNWISKFGISFKEPITAIGEGWVVNGQYETSFQSDNPKSAGTYIGDVQSTIGIASNYVDGAAEYKLDIGRKPNLVWLNIREFGIFNDDPASPMGEIHARQGIYMSNGIYAQYKPHFVQGLTLSTDYSLSEKVGTSNKYAASARYEWDRYIISGTRFDDHAGNESNLITGAVKIPELNSRVTAIVSDDKQTGTPFPTTGLTTKGYSAQWAWNAMTNDTVLVGYGHRDDGVNAYTLGNDYKLSKRATIQLHYQHVESDRPIVFTTMNDIGPLFGTNGGGAAATGTRRDQLALGLKFVF